jgi:site-specific DNA-cytosine methylase
MNDSSINSFLSVGKNGFAEYTHGSLFTGIGMFDLAAYWMGWKNVFQVEKDEFCLNVLNKRFPDVKKYTDINDFDGKKYHKTIDVISGGFPCQKYSQAGRQKGNDPLKNETLRVLSEILPAWAVLENVGNFIGSKFAQEHNLLCTYLEDIGYEVQTYDIDAASCGLSTMERHIWIVAKNVGIGTQGSRKERLSVKSQKRETFSNDLYNPGKRNGWILSAPKLCRVGERYTNRVDRLKSIGNSIPPDIAYEIFNSIQIADRQMRGEEKTINTVKHAHS